ncbi:MAG: hypothetical protein HQK81_09215 [Desulfovibrionaceae bacterium]|nr:hypothetical protein [Desulfovibrionaceae bacterium]MBF0514222.1 hypothetical protein [Desulfovibrionaceae bacterium]
MRMMIIVLALILAFAPPYGYAKELDKDQIKLLSQFKEDTFILLEMTSIVREMQKSISPDDQYAKDIEELSDIGVSAYMASQHVFDLMTMYQVVIGQDASGDKEDSLSQMINLRGYLYYMLSDGWKWRAVHLVKKLPEDYILKYDKLISALVSVNALFNECHIYEKLKLD